MKNPTTSCRLKMKVSKLGVSLYKRDIQLAGKKLGLKLWWNQESAGVLEVLLDVVAEGDRAAEFKPQLKKWWAHDEAQDKARAQMIQYAWFGPGY